MFIGITERTGSQASAEQLEILITRYSWAASLATHKRVLEVACGAGVGLEHICALAKSLEAWDIEEANVDLALLNCKNYSAKKLTILKKPAEDLSKVAENSFDLIIAFECTYYFDDPEAFFAEAYRVLSPNGRLIISSVNPSWHSFNPSPYSRHYYDAPEFSEVLSKIGFDVTAYRCFTDFPDGVVQNFKKKIKLVAVKYKLIPKTMKGKAILKRLFMGRLFTIPSNIFTANAEIKKLEVFDGNCVSNYHKMIYFECVKL